MKWMPNGTNRRFHFWKGLVFSSLLSYPDQLWGPTSLLSLGYYGLCHSGVKQLEQKLTLHLHLVLQLRTYGGNVYTYLWCCIRVLVCSWWDVQPYYWQKMKYIDGQGMKLNSNSKSPK